MADDLDSPERLLSVPNEVEAAVIVNALAERGINAFALGGNTAGFAWGDSRSCQRRRQAGRRRPGPEGVGRD